MGNILELNSNVRSDAESEQSNDNQNICAATVFYNVKEVAKVLQCSIPTARAVMHRKDFPLIKIGKGERVLKEALEQWAMERRE